jgi:hypothetical protein
MKLFAMGITGLTPLELQMIQRYQSTQVPTGAQGSTAEEQEGMVCAFVRGRRGAFMREVGLVT